MVRGEDLRPAGHDEAAVRHVLHRHCGHQLQAAVRPPQVPQRPERCGDGCAAQCVQMGLGLNHIDISQCENWMS